MGRNTVEVTVFNDDDISCELPEKPDEFMAWWQDKLDMVPVEYKASAKIEVECYEGYGSGQLEVTVSYTRPENDEEVAKRELRERKNQELQERQELCEFERLKEKLGV